MVPDECSPVADRCRALQPHMQLDSPFTDLSDCHDQPVAHYKDEVGKIDEQLRHRGIAAKFVGEVTATRTICYLFELQNERLGDVVKLDNTMCKILEVALAKPGITAITPVPNSSRMGIVVPRKTPDTVSLHAFVSEIRGHDYEVPCVLGEDHMGVALIVDLATCQHQLVGGATGSGKSNLLKAIILGIAATCDPGHIRLILVDGKGIDLVAFEGIPHLACPVITSHPDALKSLRWLVSEMERRRTLLRKHHMPDIWQYNSRCCVTDEPAVGSQIQVLPAVLLVIDEVQTLVNGRHGEAKDLLRQITQQGRSAGILCIMATQRPSVDILQGSIKTNCPGRIAFHLPSQVDSRVVLDCPGAEALKDKGDMMAVEPVFNGVLRLQAPLVTDQDIADIRSGLCDCFGRVESLNTITEKSSERPVTLAGLLVEASSSEQNQAQTETFTVPLSRFAQIAVQGQQVLQYLNRNYGDRAWQVELVYHPFLFGQASKGWRKFKILWDIENDGFVTELSPFRCLNIRKMLEGLDSELEVFTAVRNTGKKAISPGAIPVCKNLTQEDLQSHITKLIERGLLATSSKCYSVHPAIRKTPSFSGRLTLMEVPEIPSKIMREGKHTPAKIEGYIRTCLWRLWNATLDSHMYVGVPFYVAKGQGGEIAAYCNRCATITAIPADREDRSCFTTDLTR